MPEICPPSLLLAFHSVLIMAMAAPAPAQTESVIYSFANPPDAHGPKCNLAFDGAGNMYGTTFSGGANNLGAVFKTTPAGTESVIYSFKGGSDGSHPVAGLLWNSAGFFYGTTVYGGAANNGTLFVVDPAGHEAVRYSFKGGTTDGANPYSSVVMVGSNLFGTTFNGGAFGYGTVFKLTSSGETVLHDFNSAFPTLDGSYPYASLVLRKGILYGTTTLGGTSNLGTVFSIAPSGAYTLLYSFKGGTSDGQSPYGGVLFDSKGNLYGTTYLGGPDNAGTVFEIPAVGSETVLHSFLRNGDGINPYAGMIMVKGNLYGTTLQGGSANGGTVFKITASGTETVLHSFTGGADGFNPYSTLLPAANNTFYGNTLQGGTSAIGTVFAIAP
jgi:uncharacterized repeat protein (TIGR03803 family)